MSIQLHSAASFAPKMLETITVDNKTIQVYPKLLQAQSKIEKAYGFGCTLNSVRASEENIQFKYNAMGTVTGTQTIINILRNKWHRNAEEQVHQVANLTVQSYHDNTGRVMNDALDNAGNLRPVQGMADDERRPAGITFAKIGVELDFNPITVNQPGNPVPNHDHLRAPFTYFVKLRQETVAVTDNNGNPAGNLHTFMGLPNWVTGGDQGVFELATRGFPGAITKPFTLASTTNIVDQHGDAGWDTKKKEKELKRIADECGFETIMETIRKTLVPDKSIKPENLVKSMTQEGVDAISKEPFKLNVDQFYTAINLAASLYPTDQNFPTDVVQHFVDNLAQEIKEQMDDEAYDPLQYADALQPARQVENLSHFKGIASRIEERLLNEATKMSRLARKEMSDARGMTSLIDPTTLSSLVGKSTYERSHEKYAPKEEDKGPTTSTIPPGWFAPPKSEYKKECFGCGDPSHPYMVKGVVICPKASDPRVRERAAMKYGEFKSRKKMNQKLKIQKRKKKREERDNEEWEKKQQTMVNTLVKKLEDDYGIFQDLKKAKSDDSHASNFTTTFSFPCLILQGTQTEAKKPTLPISIADTLPTIRMPIGKMKEGPSFWMNCAVDSCAQLNVGNAPAQLALAEAFPQCVSKIIVAGKTYSPIQLMGIIEENGGKIKEKSINDLAVVIEWFIPLKPSALIRSTTTIPPTGFTLKFALGKHVSVNMILGIPFLKAAKCIIDMDDSVVTSKIFEGKPFQIEDRAPEKGIPPHMMERAKMAKQGPELSENANAVINVAQYLRSALEDYPNEGDLMGPIAIGINKSDYGLRTSPLEWVQSQENAIRVGTTIRAINELQHGHSVEARRVPSRDDDLNDRLSRNHDQIINIPKLPYRARPKSKWVEKNSVNDDIQPGSEFIDQQHLGSALIKNTTNLPRPNPSFLEPFDPDYDQEALDKLQVAHLSEDNRRRVIELVKEFFPVFRPEGVNTPVLGYELAIDTGDHQPVRVRNNRYGMHESVYMQNHIIDLLKSKIIEYDYDSPWSSRITLASKPHQEHIKNWKDYVWRFCVNYIHLNQITRPANYPIPRCDDATAAGYGDAQFFTLLDADSGYHQIQIHKNSRQKTAFYGPGGRKYRWRVMPFGLKNAPVIFVAFMHDLKEQWDILSRKQNIDLTYDNGSSIIIDDVFVYTTGIDAHFTILRAICQIATKYQLTWKLKKAQFLPESVEFVGVDISINGNSPAQSKMQRISRFSVPRTPREIMAFLGFSVFYLAWLPWFEIRVEKMRKLSTQFPLDHQFTKEEFNEEHEKEWETITKKILSKPVLQRPNIHKRFYIKTDFSAKGLGFALCQPSDDPEAIEAMNREIQGGKCEFEITLTNKSLRLRPVALGSRKCVGNEIHFHSHPGEALASSWGITKNRHYLWGREFTLITDHRALLWLMNYQGNNHAVKRLQLELHGYMFTTVHRPERMLADANYMSRLSEDKHMDPLLKDYCTMAEELYRQHKPSNDKEIKPENMPGRRPTKRTKLTTTQTNVDMAMVDMSESYMVLDEEEELGIKGNPVEVGLIQTIQNIPFDTVQTGTRPTTSTLPHKGHTELAHKFKAFKWCLFEPKHGHFIDVCNTEAINFKVDIAIESTPQCRDSLNKVWDVPKIFNSAEAFINEWENITKDMTLHIDGYYASMPEAVGLAATEIELTKQSKIIALLREKSHANLFVIEARSTQQSTIKNFISKMKERMWTVTSSTISSAVNFHDSVDQKCTIIIGMNNHGSAGEEGELEFIPPIQPPRVPNQMILHINQEFNKFDYALTTVNDIFHIVPMHYSINQPIPVVTHLMRPIVTVNLVEKGYEVYDVYSPAPPPSKNQLGLFGRLFGIQFTCETPEGQERTLIRSITNAEYISTYNFSRKFNEVVLRHQDSMEHLMHTMPQKTMGAVIICCHKILKRRQIRIARETSTNWHEVNDSNILSGVVPSNLPQDETWKEAYNSDNHTKELKRLAINPDNITEAEMKETIHYLYRQPLREGRIKWQDERLVMLEPIANSTESAKLIIVPDGLKKNIFTCFHVNPLGGHYSLYYTLHRIRIRYHWPNMYKDIKFWIATCAACILKNKSSKPASELLYTFPLDEPMATIHVDAWVPGKTESIAGGEEGMIIIVDHMTGFATGIEYYEATGKEFARAVYKGMLRYGLSDMVITDADSKFQTQFTEMCEILKIKHIKAARGHHDTILVERFNRFLNSAMTVFCNDRDSMRVFIEGALMTIYAWNSAPIAGTELSRSLIVCGREFKFPIDFEHRRHITTTISDADNISFAEITLELMTKCREVFKILITESRALHRELRNAQLLHPQKFKLHDIVFTKVQVQSSAKKGRSGKLSYSRRGPYIITEVLKGGSYELRKLNAAPNAKTIKKHGNTLSMCPQEIRPFPSSETSDKKFADLDKKVVDNPYYQAEIRLFNKSQPWAAAAATAIVANNSQGLASMDSPTRSTALAIIDNPPRFPSLEELEEEYRAEFNDTTMERPHSSYSKERAEGTSTNVQKSRPGEKQTVLSSQTIQKQATKHLGTEIQQLLQSNDKLYFIAYHWPNCTRKEWKLIRINFKETMNKNPDCFQNGRFLVDFYICHPADRNLPSNEQRYWLEYHTTSGLRTLSKAFTLIQPTIASEQIAMNKRLTPFKDWITINDPEIVIHGPFEFDRRFNKKTRDRINNDQWKILIANNHMYDDESPTFSKSSPTRTNTAIKSNGSEYEDKRVSERIEIFLANIRFNDQTLDEYHSI